jgi:hypothetical protein
MTNKFELEGREILACTEKFLAGINFRTRNVSSIRKLNGHYDVLLHKRPVPSETSKFTTSNLLLSSPSLEKATH